VGVSLALEEFDLGGVGTPGSPHAGAGGEDLQSVGAVGVGGLGGSFEGAGGGAVESDSQGFRIARFKVVIRLLRQVQRPGTLETEIHHDCDHRPAGRN
jgi:hypothetical protein